MPLETKLMPCPFCGNEAQESPHWALHYGCSYKTCGAYLANLTREQWNTRATPPTPPDWIKEASEEIIQYLKDYQRIDDFGKERHKERIEKILTKHAAGLVEDKERLDWLEKQPALALWQGTFDDSWVNKKLNRVSAPIVTISSMNDNGTESNSDDIGEGENLRTAITAAMKGTKP